MFLQHVADLDEKLGALALDSPYPGEGAEGQRGRAGSPKQPHLPDGWLSSRTLTTGERSLVSAAEIDASGG